MRAFRQEPYLWLHIAGLAVVPLWGLGLWLAIAAGDLLLPYGVEESLLVILGVAPWLWIQWQRPFNPFSLLVVSLPPKQLTENQRKWLSLLKRRRNRNFAVLAVFPMVWLLGQCFQLAPLASSVTPIHNHGVGLLLGALLFSVANLFMQVSLSMVGLLLLTSEVQFAAAEPYDVKKIRSDFFRFGLELPQILPPLVLPAPDPTPVKDAVAVQPNSPQASLPKEPEPSDEETSEVQEFDNSSAEAVEPVEDTAEIQPEPPEAEETQDTFETQESGDSSHSDSVESSDTPATSESEETAGTERVESVESATEMEADLSESDPTNEANVETEIVAPDLAVLTDAEVAVEIEDVDVVIVEEETDSSEVNEHS